MLSTNDEMAFLDSLDRFLQKDNITRLSDEIKEEDLGSVDLSTDFENGTISVFDQSLNFNPLRASQIPAEWKEDTVSLQMDRLSLPEAVKEINGDIFVDELQHCQLPDPLALLEETECNNSVDEVEDTVMKMMPKEEIVSFLEEKNDSKKLSDLMSPGTYFKSRSERLSSVTKEDSRNVLSHIVSPKGSDLFAEELLSTSITISLSEREIDFGLLHVSRDEVSNSFFISNEDSDRQVNIIVELLCLDCSKELDAVMIEARFLQTITKSFTENGFKKTFSGSIHPMSKENVYLIVKPFIYTFGRNIERKSFTMSVYSSFSSGEYNSNAVTPEKKVLIQEYNVRYQVGHTEILLPCKNLYFERCGYLNLYMFNEGSMDANVECNLIGSNFTLDKHTLNVPSRSFFPLAIHYQSTNELDRGTIMVECNKTKKSVELIGKLVKDDSKDTQTLIEQDIICEPKQLLINRLNSYSFDLINRSGSTIPFELLWPCHRFCLKPSSGSIEPSETVTIAVKIDDLCLVNLLSSNLSNNCLISVLSQGERIFDIPVELSAIDSSKYILLPGSTPKTVRFADTLVQSSSFCIYKLLNTGERPLNWKIFGLVENDPFKVSHCMGVLDPKKKTEIAISFCPLNAGEYNHCLEIVFDSGNLNLFLRGKSFGNEVRVNERRVEQKANLGINVIADNYNEKNAAASHNVNEQIKSPNTKIASSHQKAETNINKIKSRNDCKYRPPKIQLKELIKSQKQMMPSNVVIEKQVIVFPSCSNGPLIQYLKICNSKEFVTGITLDSTFLLNSPFSVMFSGNFIKINPKSYVNLPIEFKPLSPGKYESKLLLNSRPIASTAERERWIEITLKAELLE